MRLYLELAKKSFQRQIVYRAATLAGLVTNVFFGILRGAVMAALYGATPVIAGYTLHQAALILGLAMISLNQVWTWDKLLFSAITLIASTLFFSGLFVFGAGVSFWTVESLEAMNIVTYGGQYMTQYPMHIYPRWLRSIFTFILPMAFINYYPALWLLGKTDPLGGPAWLAFLSPLVCAIVFVIGVRFWWYGVRHYTSTGT